MRRYDQNHDTQAFFDSLHSFRSRASIVLAGATYAAIGLLIATAGVPQLWAAAQSAVVGGKISTDAPALDANSYELGEHGVSLKTGDATYSFPIAVPPGRNDMAPNLVLHYSSNAPLRGNVAAGWTLPIPVIRLDTVGSTTYGDPEVFTVSMDGVHGRLAKVADNVYSSFSEYQLEQDDAFVRFDMAVADSATYWIARTAETREILP